MTKTKIWINNDRTTHMHLSVQCASKEPWDHVKYKINPASCEFIEFYIQDDEVIYFKVWENNTAFLSGRLPEVNF